MGCQFYPVAAWVQRRLTWCRRPLATFMVFLPSSCLAEQGTQFAGQLPSIIQLARNGRARLATALPHRKPRQF